MVEWDKCENESPTRQASVVREGQRDAERREFGLTQRLWLLADDRRLTTDD